MTDKMKHYSIERISKDLYRLKIITAFKDEHTMTITKETLNALNTHSLWRRYGSEEE